MESKQVQGLGAKGMAGWKRSLGFEGKGWGLKGQLKPTMLWSAFFSPVAALEGSGSLGASLPGGWGSWRFALVTLGSLSRRQT